MGRNLYERSEREEGVVCLTLVPVHSTHRRIVPVGLNVKDSSEAASGVDQADEIGTLELVFASPIERAWSTNLSIPTYVDVHTLDRSQADWLVKLFSFLSWKAMRGAWSREGAISPEGVDIMLQNIIEQTALLVWSLLGDLDGPLAAVAARPPGPGD